MSGSCYAKKKKGGGWKGVCKSNLNIPNFTQNALRGSLFKSLCNKAS